MATETYQLAIGGIESASYRQTILHFQGVGVATNDTLAAAESLIAGFKASMETLFLAGCSTQYQLIQYLARRVSLLPSATRETKYALGAKTGTRGTNGIGQQTSPSIFLVPTMGTKSGGKIFWPSVANADIVNNAYASGFKTAVIAFVNAGIAGFANGGITWTLVIYSRKLNTTSAVTKMNFSPLIGFQGKRRRPTGSV